MDIIKNGQFDEERAFYASRGILLESCRFDGPADGESALKECRDISAENCYFNLRYPFWHDTGVKLSKCELTELCRAALWYSEGIDITGSTLNGIKALRECRDVKLSDCRIVSPEFGWSTKNCSIENTTASGEYFFMRGEELFLSNVKFTGKYSFQYVNNAVITNCVFDTKDAFWHTDNVTVTNSVINGEYLAWYSNHLTLIDCIITGTQPLCYCKNLKLINCAMRGCDLSFEKSSVSAELREPIDSVKNPLNGRIIAPAIGAVIVDDENSKCNIIQGNINVR